jgi:hypothetical protein
VPLLITLLLPTFVLTALGTYDYVQTAVTLRANVPILCHLRYFFESIRPELRTLSGGKPVGIKLGIGHPWEFIAIIKAMVDR